MVPTSPDKFIRAKKESEFGFALAPAGFKLYPSVKKESEFGSTPLAPGFKPIR
jgi:hypothetical protein